ncbi:unnamed protein product [Penicillium discolor]
MGSAGRGSAVERVLDAVAGLARRVLHVLAGLLRVGLHLIRLTFGLELLVVGELAEAFLDLATQLLSGILHVICATHKRLLSWTDRLLFERRTGVAPGARRVSCPSSWTKGAVCDGRDDDGCHVQEHGVDARHGDDGHVGAPGLYGRVCRLRAGLHRVRDAGDGLRPRVHELRGHVPHDDAIDAPHAGDDPGHDDGDAGRVHRDVPDVHGRVHAARRSQ